MTASQERGRSNLVSTAVGSISRRNETNGRRSLRDFVKPLSTRGLEPQEGKCDRYKVFCLTNFENQYFMQIFNFFKIAIRLDGLVHLEHYERSLNMTVSSDGETVKI